MDADTRGPVAVAVVEDHPLYRQALARVVSTTSGFRVSAAVGSLLELHEAERRPGAARADVILMDLNLPGPHGPAGVADLAAAGRAVLVVSAAAKPTAVAEALAAGARGYLTKDADAVDIIAGLRTLAAGGRLPPPHHVAGDDPVLQAVADLSPRELEVLKLLAEGRTDRGIAADLVISVRTVQSHLDRVREKTGRRRRSELTGLAFAAGLVDGDATRP